MKRRSRIVAGSFLAVLAAALVLGITLAERWGGSMEAMLLLFGDRVWVTVDSGSPRLWLLLLIPGVFLAAAFSLFARRSGD